MWAPVARPITALALAGVVLAACSGGSADTPVTSRDPASLALINGTLINGTGSDPVVDGVIVIEGDRIVAVGASDRVSVPPDTPTVDLQGATVLPGFINAHVHGAYDEDLLAAWAQDGVTTVRDLGTWIDNDGTGSPPPAIADLCAASEVVCGTSDQLFGFRDEVAADPRFARLVAAGPILGLPRDRHDVRWIMESPEQAEQTVNVLIDDGADLIKIYITEPTVADAPTQDTATAIVDSAHARGVPVAAHVIRTVHLAYALDAEVDDLVHMVVTTVDDDLLARVVEDGVAWVPTLELWHCVGNLTQVTKNLRSFSQAGGQIALGTDYLGAECDWDLGMPMTEIELMLDAEMTPMQVITAATQNAAHVCGLGDELGTLEVGRIADILVVGGDPLEDIQALTDVRLVVHNGAVIRDEFAATE